MDVRIIKTGHQRFTFGINYLRCSMDKAFQFLVFTHRFNDVFIDGNTVAGAVDKAILKGNDLGVMYKECRQLMADYLIRFGQLLPDELMVQVSDTTMML